jgi:hypothetical protein
MRSMPSNPPASHPLSQSCCFCANHSSSYSKGDVASENDFAHFEDDSCRRAHAQWVLDWRAVAGLLDDVGGYQKNVPFSKPILIDEVLCWELVVEV